jgi:hypothetical protein
MSQRLAATGDRGRQLVIQRQPEPITAQGLVEHGVARSQGQTGVLGEDLPASQIFEVWPTNPELVLCHQSRSYGFARFP